MTTDILNKLIQSLEKEQYKGYDPYDTLLSKIPLLKIGKWPSIIATQFQKRNPVNIRPLIGIKKEYNPKAMGLFLYAYSLLYKLDPKTNYLNKMEEIFQWLISNYSDGYSGYCWGYNFPWASPFKVLKPFIPSSVVTGFVIKGIYEYYKVTNKKRARDIIESACQFLLNDLIITEDKTGICFSYTPILQDCCYNASLLAAGTLARFYTIKPEMKLLKYIESAANFVLERQKEDGHWNYSLDLRMGKEKEQIDFHQGYLLESFLEIGELTPKKPDTGALKKGLEFYCNMQFTNKGRSKWRLPSEWPADIHHQAQGIITFSKYENMFPGSIVTAKSILKWTIDNMFNAKGYFYYQKHRIYTNRMSYIRWSQAWMLLAIAIFKFTNANLP